MNKINIGSEAPLVLTAVTLFNPSDLSQQGLSLQKQRRVQAQQLHNGRLSLGIFCVKHLQDTMLPRPIKSEN